MLATPLARRLGEARGVPAAMAIGAVCGCAVVALADPAAGGYPVCPTRALLGIDCPACGTLRGLHALSRGHVGAALDHNVLLALAVPVGLLVWLRWVSAAIGRPPRPVSVPSWVVPATIAIAIAFAILRNLPLRGVAWLDSSA